MKVIIAGCRQFIDWDTFDRKMWVMEHSVPITEVVSGGAVGTDAMAERYAKMNGLPLKVFKPDYDKYPPKVAPHVRNQQMADYADMLIAFWDGKSTGTKSMIDKAKKKGIRVEIIDIYPQLPTKKEK